MFVHGWRDAKETWQPIIQVLKANNRCIALDLPNFGASGHSSVITSLDAYAQTVKQFLQKLAVDNYALVGHSMGGQIGIFAVGSGILTPQHLVLVAAAGVRDEKQTQKSFLRGLSKPLRHVIPDTVKAKFYKRIGSDYDPSLAPELKATIAHMLDTDIQSFARRITTPTLLIYGEQDASTPPRFGQKLRAVIKDAQYKELTGQDHWLHQHAPSEIAQLIQEFTR